MPFIQRLVQPTFLSRRRCINGGINESQYPDPQLATSLSNQNSKDKSIALFADYNRTNSITVDAITEGSTSVAVISSSCTNNENNDVIICNDNTATTTAGNEGSAFNNIPLHDDGSCEFDTVTNITLSNALRQMASILIIANEIFLDLNGQLQDITHRSQELKEKLNILEKKVDKYDPKTVNVPVSDLGAFAQIKIHYKHKDVFDKELFTRETRSRSVQALYEAAKKSPINLIKHEKGILDNADNTEFLCTPVLGQTTRKMKTKINAEIEIRLPAGIEDLRKWTSIEAIGDITVTPDCINKIGCMTILNDMTTGTEIGSHISGISSITADINNSSAFTRAQPSASTITEGDNYSLDHRLPSPEEQCKTIALKFPAEVIVVDISGCQFDRLASVRKSVLLNNAANTKCDQSGLNSINNQPVPRRQRSRRSRSKRRNTIVGTDQKEIEEAVNGETDNLPENEKTTSIKVERSRSSDILKNDSVIHSAPTAIEFGKATLTKFNSLKEWGRNRLRLIGRNDDTNKTKSLEISDDLANKCETNSICKDKEKFSDKDKKSLYEKKPCYSSSEKGTPVLLSEIVNSVRLRNTSSLKRQRNKNVMKKEDLHSSSGNWSASSESGRTSIASEITVQPKSSASSSSLNHCHQIHSINSGAMGSVPSRRRFLNTSASSSAASDGTATPDLQMCDPFYDDETSSAYSCDTEGYYTSFHVDSGLKTLKEEEPVTPLQSCSALSSSNSCDTSMNQTILSAENEYEIFGRGSTSTTTSSAGTVCTTLLATDNESNNNQVPAVPERKSSLSKLNCSNSTLERSVSSSTVGSTLERSGTIKRNGVFVQKEVSAIVHQQDSTYKWSPQKQTDSSDNVENKTKNVVATITQQVQQQQQQQYQNQIELEYSESSDIEGVDRVERIRQKTEINTRRIPSICLITPTTSDDETTKESLKYIDQDEIFGAGGYTETHFDAVHNKKLESEKKSKEKTQIININKDTGYATIQTIHNDDMNNCEKDEIISVKDVNFNRKRTHLYPFDNTLESTDDYVLAGEYVRISDVSNNINWTKNNSNDIVSDEKIEYVSLNELPCNIRDKSNNLLPMHINVSKESEKINNDIKTTPIISDTIERGKTTNNITTQNLTEGEFTKGARVLFDAQGKIIYNTNSLKRGKTTHTTFIPGPFVKDLKNISPSPKVITPTTSSLSYKNFNDSKSSLNNIEDYSEHLNNLHDTLHNYEKPNFLDSSIKNVNEQQLERTNNTNNNNNNNNNNSKDKCNKSGKKNNMSGLEIDSESVMVSNTDDFKQGNQDFQHSRRHFNLDEMDTSSMLASFDSKFSLSSQSYQSPFGRDNRLYWTLQSNKRQSSKQKLLFDDNAIKNTNNSEITNRKSLKYIPQQGIQTHFKHDLDNFQTSTPLKDSSEKYDFSLTSDCFSPINYRESLRKLTSSPKDNNENLSSKTCSDRLGTPKTSLMDFKKLLLATSSKNNMNKKLSAVEMLKLNKMENQRNSTKIPSLSSSSSVQLPIQSTSALNTSMNILELSNSPKTYAKRRNFRLDNNLGSPSKSFGKQRNNGWRMNTTRTDVISTAIPEVNNEEDSSGSDSMINRPIITSTPQQQKQQEQQENVPEKNIIDDKVDLKKNIFLQAEENNFMKGEVMKKNLKTIIQSNNNNNFNNKNNIILNSQKITTQDEIKNEQKPQIEQQKQIRGSNIKVNKDPLALETAL